MRTMLLDGTRLEAGRVIPGSSLLDPRTGEEVSLWRFRGRSALVLAFLHEACERCGRFASELAAHEEELRFADARVLVVAGGEWPFRSLTDPAGALEARVLAAGAERPVVVVTDRYTAAHASFPAPGHAFPAPQEVAATVTHLATMCPECGVPTWTA